jgi:hypothetical protein
MGRRLSSRGHSSCSTGQRADLTGVARLAFAPLLLLELDLRRRAKAVQVVTSALMVRANSSAELPTGSSSAPRRRVCTSGSLTIRMISVSSFLMIVGGVRAGARKPAQLTLAIANAAQRNNGMPGDGGNFSVHPCFSKSLFSWGNIGAASEGGGTMMRMIAVVFAMAAATSAQAMPLAPLQQTARMFTEARFGCGPGRTLVAGRCVARTTIRHTRRVVRRSVRY